MAAAVAVGLAGGCANQSAPPGGPDDRRPPVVVRTEPDTFAVMLDLDSRVRFHFDERISENVSDGGIEQAVTVSPLTGDVRVSHGRTSLTVWLEGGFRPGLVYRVTLLPVLSDLFGNRMRDAFEVVFSTGGDAPPTATLAGDVWDRLSGSGVSGAIVRAVGLDSLVHLARTDDRGVFAFRYLPAGEFVLTGFQDTDRDRDVGAREARGSVATSLAAGDTVLVDISVLAPDTTAAVAGAGRVLDSVTIVVEFDDFLDPAVPVDQISLGLTRDEGDAPVVTRLFHERAYGLYVDQIADSFARLDSLDAAARAAAAPAPAPDSTADSLTVQPPDSTVVAPPDSAAVTPTDPGRDTVTVPGRPLPPRLAGSTGAPRATPGRAPPGRRIVGLLDRPLESGVAYQLRVTSVVNINGLPGGGGDATVVYEPPPPDTIPQEAGGIPGGGVGGNTGGAADSTAAADTLGLRP